MLITLMTQNIARGGLHDSKGNYSDRWPLLADRINSAKPDLLLLQELNGWKDFGHKQLVRAMNDLGMSAAPLAPTETGYGTGLLYKTEVVGQWQYHNNALSHATTHGFAVTGFDVGLPELLTVTPVHLSFYSASKAEQEMQLIINKTLPKSPFAIIGGDINFSPAQGPVPDYNLSKPYNWAARTIIESEEPLSPEAMQPNRSVAWTLKRANFVDVAQELYEQTQDEDLLTPTAVDERIDQFWVSAALAPAIVSCQKTTKNPEATDHAGVIITIDTDKIIIPDWKPELL